LGWLVGFGAATLVGVEPHGGIDFGRVRSLSVVSGSVSSSGWRRLAGTVGFVRGVVP
jgi:hypothetical protein